MEIRTDEQFIHAFDHGHKFTEEESWHFLAGHFGKRESIGNTSVYRICGRYFAIDWREGLTKPQNYSQPYEVAKHEYEKTIKVVEWKRIEKEELES